MGAKWKELDDSEKKVCCSLTVCAMPQLISNVFQPYIDQAARDKTRADTEKADYEVSCLCNSRSDVSFKFYLCSQKKSAGSGGDGEEDDE